MRDEHGRGRRWTAARALTAVLVCLGVSVAGCGRKEAAPPPLPTQSAAEKEEAVTREVEKPVSVDWPTFHGEPSLNGVADVALPEALTQVWQFDAGASVVNAPVAGTGRIFFTNEKGSVFAVDLAGKEVWRRSFNVPATETKAARQVYFDAPLAFFGGLLFACTADGEVYALEPATGETRWMCETVVTVLGSPNFGTVTVDGEEQQRLYVIDQTAGGLVGIDIGPGKVVFHSEGKDRCDASPAVGGGYAVFGSCASAVHVFSAANGDMKREIPLDQDSQIAGGVVLIGETVYSASRSGKFIHANVKTGAVIWTNTDCEGEATSTPAVGGGYVVFGANDGVLYALDAKTGVLKWKQQLGDTPMSPVIAQDKVVVSADGELRLMKLEDGATLWSFPVSDAISSPAIVGALVVVGADDGTVRAFGGKVEETTAAE